MDGPYHKEIEQYFGRYRAVQILLLLLLALLTCSLRRMRRGFFVVDLASHCPIRVAQLRRSVECILLGDVIRVQF